MLTVFKANRSEMEWVVQRCGHNMEQSRDDATVRLRGLPFQCNSEEIVEFFEGNVILIMLLFSVRQITVNKIKFLLGIF